MQGSVFFISQINELLVGLGIIWLFFLKGGGQNLSFWKKGDQKYHILGKYTPLKKCVQGFVKCGYAGSNFPDHIFPSMVGRPIIRAATKIDDVEVGFSFWRKRKKFLSTTAWLYMFMLPAEWIQGWTQTFRPNISIRNISLQFF